MKGLWFLILLLFFASASRADVIYVPYNVGGWSDIVARVVAKYEKNSLVLNVNAGRSTQGFDTVYKRKQLISMGMSFLITDPILYPKDPKYDFLKNFDIFVLGYSPNILFVNSTLNTDNLKDLKKSALEKELLYSTSGSFNHIAILEFLSALGINARQIPYNGGAQSTLAVLSNQVHLSMTNLTGLQSIIQNKNIRILGVSSSHRIKGYPEIPTLQEQLNQPFTALAYAMIAVPKSMDKKDLDYWHRFILNISNDREFVNDLEKIGLVFGLIHGKEFELWFQKQNNFYRKMVDKYNVKG